MSQPPEPPPSTRQPSEDEQAARLALAGAAGALIGGLLLGARQGLRAALAGLQAHLAEKPLPPGTGANGDAVAKEPAPPAPEAETATPEAIPAAPFFEENAGALADSGPADNLVSGAAEPSQEIVSQPAETEAAGEIHEEFSWADAVTEEEIAAPPADDEPKQSPAEYLTPVSAAFVEEEVPSVEPATVEDELPPSPARDPAPMLTATPESQHVPAPTILVIPQPAVVEAAALAEEFAPSEFDSVQIWPEAEPAVPEILASPAEAPDQSLPVLLAVPAEAPVESAVTAIIPAASFSSHSIPPPIEVPPLPSARLIVPADALGGGTLWLPEFCARVVATPPEPVHLEHFQELDSKPVPAALSIEEAAFFEPLPVLEEVAVRRETPVEARATPEADRISGPPFFPPAPVPIPPPAEPPMVIPPGALGSGTLWLTEFRERALPQQPFTARGGAGSLWIPDFIARQLPEDWQPLGKKAGEPPAAQLEAVPQPQPEPESLPSTVPQESLGSFEDAIPVSEDALPQEVTPSADAENAAEAPPRLIPGQPWWVIDDPAPEPVPPPPDPELQIETVPAGPSPLVVPAAAVAPVPAIAAVTDLLVDAPPPSLTAVAEISPEPPAIPDRFQQPGTSGGTVHENRGTGPDALDVEVLSSEPDSFAIPAVQSRISFVPEPPPVLPSSPPEAQPPETFAQESLHQPAPAGFTPAPSLPAVPPPPSPLPVIPAALTFPPPAPPSPPLHQAPFFESNTAIEPPAGPAVPVAVAAPLPAAQVPAAQFPAVPFLPLSQADPLFETVPAPAALRVSDLEPDHDRAASPTAELPPPPWGGPVANKVQPAQPSPAVRFPPPPISVAEPPAQSEAPAPGSPASQVSGNGAPGGTMAASPFVFPGAALVPPPQIPAPAAAAIPPAAVPQAPLPAAAPVLPSAAHVIAPFGQAPPAPVAPVDFSPSPPAPAPLPPASHDPALTRSTDPAAAAFLSGPPQSPVPVPVPIPVQVVSPPAVNDDPTRAVFTLQPREPAPPVVFPPAAAAASPGDPAAAGSSAAADSGESSIEPVPFTIWRDVPPSARSANPLPFQTVATPPVAPKSTRLWQTGGAILIMVLFGSAWIYREPIKGMFSGLLSPRRTIPEEPPASRAVPPIVLQGIDPAEMETPPQPVSTANQPTPPAATATADNPASAAASPPSATTAASSPLPSDPVAAGAQTVLEKFLKAATIDEILPMVRDGTALRPRIESWLKSMSTAPRQVEEIQLKSANRGREGDLRSFRFSVVTADHPEGCPAIVDQTPDGFAVDWDAYVQCRDRMLQRFLSDASAESVPFYAVVRRSTYFGKEKIDEAELAKHISLKVNTPNPDDDGGYILVPKGTPLARFVEARFTWDTICSPVIELERRNGHIYLARVLRETWRGRAQQETLADTPE